MLETQTRPWGHYKILYEDDRCKVKEILVRAKGRLSLQSHQHRKESWTFTRGTGRVELDGEKVVVSPGTSITINKQQKHRVENVAHGDLVFIEVQTGDYFGEHDISRYEDDYGRTEKGEIK